MEIGTYIKVNNPKPYEPKARTWVISYAGKTCLPDEQFQRREKGFHYIDFLFNNKLFTVEFDNQSDMYASENGHGANVTIWTSGRTKKALGTAMKMTDASASVFWPKHFAEREYLQDQAMKAGDLEQSSAGISHIEREKQRKQELQSTIMTLF